MSVNSSILPKVHITLSKPWASNRLPRTSPMPAKSVTGLSPIGSETNSLSFCDVDDMVVIGTATRQK